MHDKRQREVTKTKRKRKREETGREGESMLKRHPTKHRISSTFNRKKRCGLELASRGSRAVE